MAIQLCRLYGANAIAVVSSEDKADLCRRLGAHAVINRRDFAPHRRRAGEPNLDEVKRFGKAVREATGGVDCDIVFEHVGSATFFTSVFVCRTFGKIVTCGATSGFSLTFDVRYLWMRQKTIIGSHFANAYQAYRANQLIDAAQDPARALAHVPVRGVPRAAPDDARERAPREDGRARRRRGVSESARDDLGHRGQARSTGPSDEGDPARIGAPGAFPFTRGLRADGYRTRPWTIRQYAGYGTAQEANERFRFLLAQGQPGLSVAFDLPTQMGLDSDDPRSLGEVGRVGVAIDSLDDVVALFDGIPLDQVSTSMTINAPAPVLVAMYVVAAELQGVPAGSVRGTAQNDVLKEYVARGTYIYPPRPEPAPRGRPRRLVRDRGAALQRHLALRLPHARGGLHGGAGDGVRARQRDRLRRGRARARRGRRRLRARGSRGSSTRTRTSSRRSRSTARCGACGRR